MQGRREHLCASTPWPFLFCPERRGLLCSGLSRHPLRWAQRRRKGALLLLAPQTSAGIPNDAPRRWPASCGKRQKNNEDLSRDRRRCGVNERWSRAEAYVEICCRCKGGRGSMTDPSGPGRRNVDFHLCCPYLFPLSAAIEMDRRAQWVCCSLEDLGLD